MVELLKKLDDIIIKNRDLIYSEAQSQKRDLAISSPLELTKVLSEIEEDGKTLKIGIVGRVKAGKSSLLNALIFDGETILPKAATPMTAALTILKYSPKIEAEIEFFRKDDIEYIRKDAQNYESNLEKLTNEKFKTIKERKERNKKELTNKELIELKEKSRKQARRELKDSSASFEQYQKITSSSININNLKQFEIIRDTTLKSLSEKLSDYVGANGKYMPFTKSVTIKLPNETLKGLEIIDTPGVNDPVISREERTRELLKYCDVIFVISSSGQFLSEEDIDLMDRITTKEGIREIFILASQVDNQLFGSEKDRFNGVLPEVLSGITTNLGNTMCKTLSKLKEHNPEIGNVFDNLIEDGKNKVLHSSGISHSLKKYFDEKNKWDDGMKKVWENLTREYPDYFSNNKDISIANLELLSNIKELDNNIKNVREKKDIILKEKRDNFLKIKIDSLNKYKQNLIEYIENQIEKIENSDIDEIKKRKIKLSSIQVKGSRKLNDDFIELVEELDIEIKQQLNQKLSSFFRKSKNDINDAESTETESWQESYEVSTSKWYNPFSWGSTETRYETKSETYTTVRAGAIRNSLEELTDKIEVEVEDEAKKFIISWRKKVYSKLVKTLRETVGDEDLDVDIIKSTIRNVINSIEYPSISYTGVLPNDLRKSGVLKSKMAEEYLDEARDYIYSLEERVKNDLKSYRKKLIKSLEKQDLSQNIFSHYKNEIEKLEEKISTKELTLEKYNNLLKELEEV